MSGAKRGDIDAVEAAGVDADPVGVQARPVEGVDAAMPAEDVLGRAGVEAVDAERVLAREQCEIRLGDGQVQYAFFMQIEQLHSEAAARSARARNRTAPQWQPPS